MKQTTRGSDHVISRCCHGLWVPGVKVHLWVRHDHMRRSIESAECTSTEYLGPFRAGAFVLNAKPHLPSCNPPPCSPRTSRPPVTRSNGDKGHIASNHLYGSLTFSITLLRSPSNKECQTRPSCPRMLLVHSPFLWRLSCCSSAPRNP